MAVIGDDDAPRGKKDILYKVQGTQVNGRPRAKLMRQTIWSWKGSRRSEGRRPMRGGKLSCGGGRVRELNRAYRSRN